MTGWNRIRDWLRRRARTGGAGERHACRHLRRAGYRVLGRNLRNRFGEVDILAEAPDRNTIVVVEVKATRATGGDPPPEVHVNTAKQRRLVALACQLARARRFTERPIRFDVIGVQLQPDGADAIVRHHPGAFESHV